MPSCESSPDNQPMMLRLTSFRPSASTTNPKPAFNLPVRPVVVARLIFQTRPPASKVWPNRHAHRRRAKALAHVTVATSTSCRMTQPRHGSRSSDSRRYRVQVWHWQQLRR
jgi:hypothetical protein